MTAADLLNIAPSTRGAPSEGAPASARHARAESALGDSFETLLDTAAAEEAGEKGADGNMAAAFELGIVAAIQTAPADNVDLVAGRDQGAVAADVKTPAEVVGAAGAARPSEVSGSFVPQTRENAERLRAVLADVPATAVFSAQPVASLPVEAAERADGREQPEGDETAKDAVDKPSAGDSTQTFRATPLLSLAATPASSSAPPITLQNERQASVNGNGTVEALDTVDIKPEIKDGSIATTLTQISRSSATPASASTGSPEPMMTLSEMTKPAPDESSAGSMDSEPAEVRRLATGSEPDGVDTPPGTVAMNASAQVPAANSQPADMRHLAAQNALDGVDTPPGTVAMNASAQAPAANSQPADVRYLTAENAQDSVDTPPSTVAMNASAQVPAQEHPAVMRTSRQPRLPESPAYSAAAARTGVPLARLAAYLSGADAWPAGRQTLYSDTAAYPPAAVRADAEVIASANARQVVADRMVAMPAVASSLETASALPQTATEAVSAAPENWLTRLAGQSSILVDVEAMSTSQTAGQQTTPSYEDTVSDDMPPLTSALLEQQSFATPALAQLLFRQRLMDGAGLREQATEPALLQVASTRGATIPLDRQAPLLDSRGMAVPGVSSQTAASALPAPESNLTGQIVQAIRLQWRGTGGEARIRLQPEHLGEVVVVLNVDRGDVTATVQAQTSTVRAWIESHAQDLRSALADQGLHLGQLVVSEHGATPRRRQAPEGRQRQGRPQARGQESPRFEIHV